MNCSTAQGWLALLCVLASAGCTTVTVQTGVATQIAPPPAPPAPAPDVPAIHLTADDIGALPPLGSSYTGTLPLLGKSIPLPNGVWRVVQQTRSTFRGYPPGANVALVRAEGTTMTGLLQIAGNAINHPSSHGWPLNPICGQAGRLGISPTILAADTEAAEPGGDQDCVTIGAVRTADWGQAGTNRTLQGLSRSLEKLGIVPPVTAVLVAFGETDGAYRLNMQLLLNPDLAGITPDPEPLPLLNAWAANRLSADPARRAYVDRLMAWAQQWRQVVRQTLDQPSPATPDAVAEIR